MPTRVALRDPAHQRTVAAVRGGDDDGAGGVGLEQRVEGAEPVVRVLVCASRLRGDLQIEHHHVGPEALGEPARVLQGGGARHVVRLRLQPAGVHLGVLVVVLDEKHALRSAADHGRGHGPEDNRAPA
jgi:hypothetical protein